MPSARRERRRARPIRVERGEISYQRNLNSLDSVDDEEVLRDFLVRQALEHEVGHFRALDVDEFEFLEPVDDSLGQRLLADLALAALPVVGDAGLERLFSNFAVDPLLQAEVVDELAGSLALARRDEEVVVLLRVSETDLALLLHLGFHLVRVLRNRVGVLDLLERKGTS